MKKYLIILFIFFVYSESFSQKIKIIDGSDNPIPFVSIFDNLKKKGIITDKNGEANLEIFNDDEIIVIQLAVYSFDGLIANYPIEKIRDTFELNLFSNINLVKAILPLMIDQKWGRFIHFSSIVGNKGSIGAGIYSSSKSALNGYSKTLSKEYGRFGITSNIIELGYFDKGLINVSQKIFIVR